MSLRMWVAPVGLFVLQGAPVGIEADSTGRLRLLLGASAGSYEERLVNCAGDVLDSYPVSVRAVGVEAEYWPSPSLRLAGYGGVLDGSTERAPADRINTPYEGSYGGALAAYEGRVAGIGAGITVYPNTAGYTEVLPSFYARIGSLDGLHFRTGITGPPGEGAGPPLLRVGLGLGQGHVRKIGGTLGFALDPVGGRDPTASLLGSVMVPVTGALEVGGTTGVRYGNSATWHVGVQARVALGAPPR